MNNNGASHQVPNRIIVHSMGEYITHDGYTYNAEDWLIKLGLSAHALIYPDGRMIRVRRDDQGAYHAKGHNTDSLGVEFLVPGVHDYGTFLKAIKTDYITENAFQSGLNLIREWMLSWSITRIDRHSDVDPKRKKDPGKGFPWERFLEEL